MIKNKNLNGKIRLNKFLINGFKGFILATMPIIIIELEAMISENYSFDFIYKILYDMIKYGVVGIIISLIYTYSSYFYPKISKYTVLTIIIIYYIYTTIFFIIGIYFHMIGPLFG